MSERDEVIEMCALEADRLGSYAASYGMRGTAALIAIAIRNLKQPPIAELCGEQGRVLPHGIRESGPE